MYIPLWAIAIIILVILGLLHNAKEEGYNKARSEDWDKTFKR